MKQIQELQIDGEKLGRTFEANPQMNPEHLLVSKGTRSRTGR
jgi:hypothetical protein